MSYLRVLSLSAAALGMLLTAPGCISETPSSTGSGGSSGSGTGGDSATGSGGSTGSGTGGSTGTGTGGSTATGGSTGTGTGGSTATGGSTGTGSGGAVGSGGSGTGTGGGGGSSGGSGGMTGSGGRSGSGGAGGRGTGSGGSTTGSGGSTGSGGAGGSTPTGGNGGVTTYNLNCGGNGWVVEGHGPPANRLNFAIIGDGYSASELAAGGTFEQHINKYMTKRFSSPIGDPYTRYRNFINICAIKVESTGKICNNSLLGCCGDDSSRLCNCNASKADSTLKSNLPTDFVIDWRAVVLNGSSWWNAGGSQMCWSGGNTDGAGAALHEGGHGFNNLADEYGDCTGANCGSNTNFSGSTGTEYGEVNSTGTPSTTSGKWDLWKGFDQTGATGPVGTWSGSRYVGSGQYRPSANSMMNSLFGNNPNTSYNPVSREQIIMTIWRAVKPIDSTDPAAGAVSGAPTLKVNVIDPAVISVDWSVDGNMVAANGGTTFDLASKNLSSGSHTVTAKAYDNAGDDLVRNKTGKCPSSVTGQYCSRTAWPNSQQTVTWMVTIP